MTALLLLFSAAGADEIEDQIDQALKAAKTIGAVVVVAKDGEIVLDHAYGYANLKQKIPATPDHFFILASVTKFVTGIGMMRLKEQGKISLDASIGDALGFEVRNLYYPDVPVTLRQVMSHTSSLRAEGGYSRSGSRLDRFLPASLGRKQEWNRKKPGSEYQYSNFGAGLMGSMIEYLTGENVNDWMTENVFDPLGMKAAYHPALLNDPEHVTTRYEKDRNVRVAASLALRKEWDSSCDPYGHFRITVGSLWMRGRDLCRAGIMLINGGELDGKAFLQPETVEEMKESQMGKPYITVDSPYGLCIHRETTLTEDGRLFYGHQGVDGGSVANIYFDPETKFVFAFITNGTQSNQSNHVVKISRKLFSICWTEWGDPASVPIPR